MSIYTAAIQRGAVLYTVLFTGLLCAGQAADKSTPDPGLQLRALNALQEFEASSAQEYTIGEGDDVDIQVVGRPELSGTQLVGPDGRITLPLSGSFEIRNLTRETAARAIADTFLRYYTSVDVTVRVSKYGSNRIIVMGHVAHPGVLYFESAPTLLEALTRDPAVGSPGTEGSSSLPRRCAIFRGKEQALWIDLTAMLEQGPSFVNLRLRRDDVLYVPDEQDNLVSVLGQVQHPGMVKLLPTTTLLQVLALSGGLTTTAGAAKIEIMRPGSTISREVSFEDLLNPHKAVESALQRGDVIYVRQGAMAKFESGLQALAPLSSVLLFGSTLLTH
jgi:polysaccharide biosynthesis/export protein